MNPRQSFRCGSSLVPRNFPLSTPPAIVTEVPAVVALALSLVLLAGTSLYAQSPGPSTAPNVSPSLLSGSLAPAPSDLAELAEPAVTVGRPAPGAGFTPVTPALRVDPNVAASAYAGTVSIEIVTPDGVAVCSGSVISSCHILTAAHCLDFAGGLRAAVPGPFAPTGDGVADVGVAAITVRFNNAVPAVQRGVSAMFIHPDWEGFANLWPAANGSINDDIAILMLDGPIPAGVPIYPLNLAGFANKQLLTMCGYGISGNGLIGDTIGAGFVIKRTGWNIASEFIVDDENPLGFLLEVFGYDFDDEVAGLDPIGDGVSLGNFFETAVRPGDSGGPSFIHTDFDSDNSVDPGELVQMGVNTYTTGEFFGERGGGMIVASYIGWIASILGVPNDFCDWALPVHPGIPYFTDTSTATPDISVCGWTAPDVWFSYAAECPGTVSFSLCGSNYDTLLAVFDGSNGCPSDVSTLIACNDDFCGLSSEVTVSVEAGQLLYVLVSGYAGAVGQGQLVVVADPCPTSPEFRRGDSNGDGSFNIGDAIHTLSALFSVGGSLACRDAADANADNSANIADAVMTLTSLFIAGAPTPGAPFPNCGVDPDADTQVDCQSYGSCP